MSLEYDDYLKKHIMYVGKGVQWMIDNLPLKELGFGDMDISFTLEEAGKHDQSKWNAIEYNAYDEYFYGGNRSYSVVLNFDYAWLDHQKKNRHHWQYWVLMNDDPNEGFKALAMPKAYILEMIADWWTFSWMNDNPYSIFDWWDEHQNYILLHKNTRECVMNVLHAMYQKLEENVEHNALMHGELTDEELEKRKYAIPDERKFPLPDKAHVKSAIRFFNYVEPKYEQQLADAILERMKEYGMSFDDFGVGDENRFKKYIPKKEEEDK